MLDTNFVRSNPELVERNAEAKDGKFRIPGAVKNCFEDREDF
jgi:hypothetical protein